LIRNDYLYASIIKTFTLNMSSLLNLAINNYKKNDNKHNLSPCQEQNLLDTFLMSCPWAQDKTYKPVVVLLWGRVLASWSLAIDERGGHEDLRRSGRRSIIPYAHGRMKLYCSSLPCLSLFFNRPLKWRLPDPFIAQCRTITLRPGARQVPRGG
jgi:hypothetical protein